MRSNSLKRFVAIIMLVSFVATTLVAAGPVAAEDGVATDEEFKPRNIFVAFGLSAILPSSGQFYNGEYRKGGLMAALIAASFVMAYGFDEGDGILSGPGGVLFWTTYAWSVFDAPSSARRINAEHLPAQPGATPAPAGTGDGADDHSVTFAPLIGVGRDAVSLGVSLRF
jgi:hypothetical protein